ncbi:flagellar hook-length control protein FliK [Brevibacillus sp. SYP-B805]|uniref:flagellar hook-length control protein FliK n=1 Tax=Brevibacillus sp. SYP-B805 TaxID=1578199 RepID=UPI0013EB7FF6|nr:flagellar hook-length control protein FliK [Brevibacillus sp. SYP-B805]NGQ94011.1 flagellar hook-length control protein FliK [Brevibacillus sp. SYP-B805]
MNVANPILAPIGPAAGVPMGQASPAASVSLGGLFAFELGSALQGMQPMDALPAVALDMNPEDMEKLADLLAVLQQMLAGGSQQLPQLTDPQTDAWSEQDLATLQSLLANYPQAGGNNAAATGVRTDLQPLITTFMQQGLSPNEAESFTQLLLALAKQDVPDTQTGPATLAQQAKQLLESLGVEVQKGETTTTAVKGTALQPSGLQLAVQSNPFSRPFHQSALKNEPSSHTLRLNQALAVYRAEAGVASTAWRPAADVPVVQGAQAGESVQPDGQPIPLFHLSAGPGNGSAVSGVSTEQTASFNGHVVHADQFAKEMGELLVKQMKLGNFRGISEAKITLHPQNLGHVDVKIIAHNGVITAHFTAETASGKEMLDNQMSQLRAALVQQGLQVDRLEVTQQQHHQPEFGFQQERGQSRQQQNQQQKKQHDEEKAEFSIEKLVGGIESAAAAWNRLQGKLNIEYSV